MADNFNYYKFLTDYKKNQVKKSTIITEAGVVTSKVIKEGPLTYKIVVKVPERPNVNYTYNVDAGSEEEALAKLEEKMKGRSYSVSSIKGFEAQPASTVDRNKVDWSSLEIGDIDLKDYPKFTDAYVESANYADGTPLSDLELDALSDDLRNTGELAQMAYETLFEGLTPREKVLKEGVIKFLNEEGVDKEIIRDYIINNHPNSEELGPKEIELITLQHLDEWNESQDNYNDIMEYLEEVKENGDFYSGNDYSKEFDSMMGDPLDNIDFLEEESK